MLTLNFYQRRFDPKKVTVGNDINAAVLRVLGNPCLIAETFQQVSNELLKITRCKVFVQRFFDEVACVPFDAGSSRLLNYLNFNFGSSLLHNFASLLETLRFLGDCSQKLGGMLSNTKDREKRTNFIECCLAEYCSRKADLFPPNTTSVLMDLCRLIKLVVTRDDANINRTIRFIRRYNNITLLYLIAKPQQNASPSCDRTRFGVRKHRIQPSFEPFTTTRDLSEITDGIPTDTDEPFLHQFTGQRVVMDAPDIPHCALPRSRKDDVKLIPS